MWFYNTGLHAKAITSAKFYCFVFALLLFIPAAKNLQMIWCQCIMTSNHYLGQLNFFPFNNIDLYEVLGFWQEQLVGSIHIFDNTLSIRDRARPETGLRMRIEHYPFLSLMPGSFSSPVVRALNRILMSDLQQS